MPKTARRKGGRNKKYFEKAKRREHDRIMDELYDCPELLEIAGLEKSSIIWSVKNYKYMHSLGHRQKGPYSCLGPDVIFFWCKEAAYHFTSVEVKSNDWNSISYDTSYDQLMGALNYFKGMWKTVIIEDIKPQAVSLRNGEVFLDVIEVCPTLKANSPYAVLWFRQNYALGTVSQRDGYIYFQ